MVDFSIARQYWQAAYWCLLSVQSNTQAQEDLCSQGDEADKSPEVLGPHLSLYGADRVMPVISSPVYHWLLMSVSSVLQVPASYCKLAPEAWEVLSLALEPPGAIAHIDTCAWPAPFINHWRWVHNYWAQHADSLESFLYDCHLLRLALPSGMALVSGSAGKVSTIGSDGGRLDQIITQTFKPWSFEVVAGSTLR